MVREGHNPNDDPGNRTDRRDDAEDPPGDGLRSAFWFGSTTHSSSLNHRGCARACVANDYLVMIPVNGYIHRVIGQPR